MIQRNRGRFIRAVLVRLLLLIAVWFVLTGGRFDDPVVAALAIAAALVASLRLRIPEGLRISPVGAIRFVPYFLLQSVLGGWDVARRALAPSVPVDPGFVTFELSLPSEPAQVFFAWIVSLLPGTASARLEGGSLYVHVLDRSLPVEDRLRQLEGYVARVVRARYRERG